MILLFPLIFSYPLNYQGAKVQKINGKSWLIWLKWRCGLNFFRNHAFLCVFHVFTTQNDTHGTDDEEGSVLNHTMLLRWELHFLHEGAGIAVVILQRIAQPFFLVPADSDGSVVQVLVWVNGLKGGVAGLPYWVDPK